MNRDQALQKLRAEQVRCIAIAHQIDGVRKLFEACVVVQNNQLADTYRQQLHDLLDVQLDSINTTVQMTRIVIEMQE